MSKKGFRAIEGTRDYFGPEGARFELTLSAAAEVFGRYGYAKITVPVFEATDLFARSIGADTDIVAKEMYTFKPGSDRITLRPEGTAGVVRAYLQHNLHKQGGLHKLWYAGPMFRRERPQKGRQRQFHQVGVEAIGAGNPLLDAEVIALGLDYYASLGITATRTRLNSIGCPAPDCRPAYRQQLRAALKDQLPALCELCRRRYERNLLRILDCRNEKCRAITRQLPPSHACLCPECETHFEAVRAALAAAEIDCQLDGTLVRGLDYYTKTVFEYTHDSLGAQNAIGGGGRYDGLVAELGGPSVPAVGFALGLERIMIAMAAANAGGAESVIQVYGVYSGEECGRTLAALLARVRAAGISADRDFAGRSFKAQLRTANKRGATVALILGAEELAQRSVTVKDMRPEGEQRTVPLAETLSAVKNLIAPE